LSAPSSLRRLRPPCTLFIVSVGEAGSAREQSASEFLNSILEDCMENTEFKMENIDFKKLTRAYVLEIYADEK
jgi:hypothetical protein